MYFSKYIIIEYISISLNFINKFLSLKNQYFVLFTRYVINSQAKTKVNYRKKFNLY